MPGADNLADQWKSFLYPAARSDLITLSLENDAFVLKSDGPPLVANPVDQVLARWWVNDKPAECPDQGRPPGLYVSRSSRKPPATDRCTIAFDLPPMLGKLKPGDRVGLQLLWVSDIAPVSKNLQAQAMVRFSGGLPVPIPTNRLDFTVNEHLLSLRSQ